MGNYLWQLAFRFAESGWKTAYTNGPLSLWDRQKDVWHDADFFSRFIVDRGVIIDRPGKSLPRWQSSPKWDEFVLRCHANRLSQHLVTEGQPLISLIVDPSFRKLASFMRPEITIYYAGDLLSHQPGWTKERELEQEALIDEADLVIAASEGVSHFMPKPRRGEIRILESAVDANPIIAAADAPCPPELEAISQPRIGYIGQLNAKVDFRAIAYTAARHPDWNWVIIGPDNVHSSSDFITNEILEAWNRCKTLPNVHILGYIPPDEVPSYINNMDVNTICYDLTVGEWTRTAYPFKLHECLAVGKPVVSANMPALQKHANVIAVADTPEQWDDALAHAINHGGVGDAASRRKTALQNTWDMRLATLQSWIVELL